MVILESAALASSEQFYRRAIGTIDLSNLEMKIREIEQVFSDEFVVGLRLMLSTNRTVRSKGLSVMLDKLIPEGPEYELLRPVRSRQQKERHCES